MTQVSWKPVVTFVVLVNVLGWLICLPLWLNPQHLAMTGGGALLTLLMFAPALAAVLTARFVERVPLADALALRSGKQIARFVWWLAIALGVTLGLVLLAQAVSAAFGVYQADLTGFSAFRQVLEAQAAAVGKPFEPPMPLPALVAVTATNAVLGGIMNTLPAAGEEAGWRGYLWPRLESLGTIPALLLLGVIWGTWHAPVLLLGYNYPTVPGWLRLVLMSVFCTLFGAVLVWLRQRTDSMWPAALAHGTLNASVGLFALLFGRADTTVDTAQATIMGWTGWLVVAAFVAVLLWRRAFTRHVPPQVKDADAAR